MVTMKNYLTFGGLKSNDHFVWISGEGTYGAPRRDVEYVSVPGRNGNLIIDNGRWENIEVTYPAFIPGDFDSHMNDFRMAMCKKLGYQRLEDTYHPDEFRMASFSEGIQTDMRQWNRSGAFDLVFNCKPQRFLKSGETPLQFIPLTLVGNEVRTGFIPVTSGELTWRVSCAAGESITMVVTTYNVNGVQLETGTYTVSDGSTYRWNFPTPSVARYFKATFSPVNNIDDFSVTYTGKTIINGEITDLNAISARKTTITNPTGYPAKPMIECFSNTLPYISITNINGDERYYYDFHSNQTPAKHFWMDCDLQYLYDADKNNLTSYLFLTTAESAAGKGLVFPELSGETIEIEMYSAAQVFSDGEGILLIYPRWWKL